MKLDDIIAIAIFLAVFLIIPGIMTTIELA